MIAPVPLHCFSITFLMVAVFLSLDSIPIKLTIFFVVLCLVFGYFISIWFREQCFVLIVPVPGQCLPVCSDFQYEKYRSEIMQVII